MTDNSKKILVIEDDTNLLNNIKEILIEEGFEVKTEIEGENGIKSAVEWMPDLIICDIALPKRNGYEVLQAISGSEKTKRIPFIFLTAKVEKDDMRKGMQLGADDYIFKPFDINDLLTSCKLRLEKVKRLHINGIENPPKNKYEMNDQISVRIGSRLILYHIKDLKYLSAESPYVLLMFSDGKNSLKRQTLDEWERKLPDKFFIRIRRSTIINTEYITKIKKLDNSSFSIQLKDNDEPFIVSKRYCSKFKKQFNY